MKTIRILIKVSGISPEGRRGHGWVLPGQACVHRARVVPVLAPWRRSLTHRHLRHGPDLWLAGRDGDALLAVLLFPVVTHPVVTQLPPHVILPVYREIMEYVTDFNLRECSAVL